MKIILQLDELKTPKTGDILIYENKKFTYIGKDSFLRQVYEELEIRKEVDSRLLEKIELLEKRIEKLELEAKFNRGEITEEEYQQCLGM